MAEITYLSWENDGCSASRDWKLGAEVLQGPGDLGGIVRLRKENAAGRQRVIAEGGGHDNLDRRPSSPNRMRKFHSVHRPRHYGRR